MKLSTNIHSVLALIIGCILLLLLLAACNPAQPPPTATFTPEPTATPRPVPTDRSEVPRILPEELKARLDQGEEILVVDTRPLSLFNIRHIAGAVSISEGEILSRLDELPRDQEIVFY